MAITKRLLPLAALALGLVVAAFIAAGTVSRSTDTALAHTGTGNAHLEVDSNASGTPCSPINASASYPAGAAVTIAICLSEGDQDPTTVGTMTADLTNFNGVVGYSALVSFPDVADDGTIDLNSNPNFQEAAAPPGGDWDCNALNGPASAPNGSPSPASITCATGDVAPNLLASPNVALAVISGTAGSPGGPDPLSISGSILNSTGEFLCGAEMTCVDGSITVTAAADIQTTKMCTPDPVLAGGLVTCAITVFNAGPSDAPNILVLDNLPDSPAVVYNDLASTTLTCDAFSAGTYALLGLPPSSNLVSCGFIGIGTNASISLLAGNSVVLNVAYDVDLSQAGKNLQNNVVATAAGLGLPITVNPVDPDLNPLLAVVQASPPCNVNPDPVTCAQLAVFLNDFCGGPAGIFIFGALAANCDNGSRDDVDVTAADVSITKEADVTQASEGGLITYTITITNDGAASIASEVEVDDTVDTNQSIQSASAGLDGVCGLPAPAPDAVNNSVNCVMNDLAPGASATVTVIAKVITSVGNVCENDASVTFADPITVNATPTSVACFPPDVRMEKDADLDTAGTQDTVNLWLCQEADTDGDGVGNEGGVANPDCEYYDTATGLIENNGMGHLVVFEKLFNNFDPEGAGAFEFQLKFDHKIFDINIQHGIDLNDDGDCADLGETSDGDDTAGDLSPTDCYLYTTGRIPNAPGGVGGCEMSIFNENFILFGCVSKNPGEPPVITDGPSGPEAVVATIHIDPEPDLKFRLTPGQKNGVLRTILDENCEAADIFGDPLGTGTYDELNREILLPGIVTGGLIEACEDLHVTVRILEGDLNLDCIVDVEDDQEIAFRYGSFFGNLLYDPWFDLEPSLKDFDVDIKDLQKVFGRNGSTCEDPIPAQAPQPGGGFNGNPDPGPLP